MRERIALELKLKAAQASATAGKSPALAPACFWKTVCGYCNGALPLLTTEAIPLGTDLCCGDCGCPLTMEFGTFSPIRAIECRRSAAAQPANESPKAMSAAPFRTGVEELSLEASRMQVAPLPASSSSAGKRRTGPVEFQPPVLSPSSLQLEPRETLCWRTKLHLEGSSSPRVLRLVQLPHAALQRATDTHRPHGSEPAIEATDMLMTCDNCCHLFIEPPAHGQLLPGDPCICCAAAGPRVPILPCAALQ